ncbi:MAG: YeiH family protein [Hyphomicrobiales bacterium]
MARRPFLLTAIVPGLALTVMTALAARVIHQQLPHAIAPVIGEVVIAVVLGLVIGNAITLPENLAPGIRFSFHRVLRAAIILLGASFSVQQVAAIGGRAVLLVAVLMTVALLAAHFLGRLAGVPPRLATLIGVGTAVCGNSAIVATAPVIDARDDEVSFAIATNTLFGTLAVFFYPLIGHLFRFHDPVFGTWAGSAVNDTSQVVATGFAYSDGAGRIATAVKLTRNALMGPVIVLMGILHGRAREGVAGSTGGLWLRVRQSIPLFVLGFLALAALQSLGLLRQLSIHAGRDLVADADFWAKVLILIALAGVGLSTRIDAMRKTGLRPFAIGLAVATATSLISLAWIHGVGPATGG